MALVGPCTDPRNRIGMSSLRSLRTTSSLGSSHLVALSNQLRVDCVMYLSMYLPIGSFWYENRGVSIVPFDLIPNRQQPAPSDPLNPVKHS